MFYLTCKASVLLAFLLVKTHPKEPMEPVMKVPAAGSEGDLSFWSSLCS